MPVRELLAARAQTHGDFAEVAATAQGLKDWWRSQAVWSRLSPVQREALDADCVKCARIAHGDHNAIEHWEDRAGYAELVTLELGKAG